MDVYEKFILCSSFGLITFNVYLDENFLILEVEFVWKRMKSFCFNSPLYCIINQINIYVYQIITLTKIKLMFSMLPNFLSNISMESKYQNTKFFVRDFSNNKAGNRQLK